MTVIGRRVKAVEAPAATEIMPPRYDLQSFGLGYVQSMERMEKSRRAATSLVDLERPSNWEYRITSQSTYWYMYSLMAWYRTEVSVLSTVINRAATELTRFGFELRAKFALKCTHCGHELQYMGTECPVCHMTDLRPPDPAQKDFFRRPNGKSFIEEVNDNGQSLQELMKAYAESEYLNNEAYLLCVTGQNVKLKNGKRIDRLPVEFLAPDVRYVRYLYDDTGKPGVDWAYALEDRNTLYNISAEPQIVEHMNAEGKILYPAAWKIGENYGGEGRYWAYSMEEVYHDHWFRPSLVYGQPIWLDIEDDLLIYHYLEKHFLCKYKYGYVRKMVILPGFNEEDAQMLQQGLKDSLAKNDNSIPIVALPPQMPGTPEMRAQTLELGTESDGDALMTKSDIRDRICAHCGVPNLFAGDVEASGGMNNESQQITVFDRYLMDKYNYFDHACKWIMSWFPMITDWELCVVRPSKAYTDSKKRMEKITECERMAALGFKYEFRDGEFWYSQYPQGQEPNMGPGSLPGGVMPDMPEKGTARREDEEIAEGQGQVDDSMAEALGALGI